MAPPVLLAQVTDPLHPEGVATPPPPASDAPPPPPAASAPVAPAPGAPAATPAAPARNAFPSDGGALRRFHAVLGGGGTWGLRLHGESEPYSHAAPSYNGPHFFLQGGYSVVDNPWGEVRIGAYGSIAPLSLERITGSSVSSNVTQLNLGALVEGDLFFGTPYVGFGVAGMLGLATFGGNVDVGAPGSATFHLFDDNSLHVGAQAYFHFWRNALRAGFQMDYAATPLAARAAGQPDLQITTDPGLGFFLGLDIPRIVDNVGGGTWNF